SDRNLRWRYVSRAGYDFAPRPGRLAGDSRYRRQRRQAANVRFRFEFDASVHILGRANRRGISGHRKPWCRSNDRAAVAGGKKPKTVGECAAFKGTGYLFSVWLISAGWSHAVRVLPVASRELRQG